MVDTMVTVRVTVQCKDSHDTARVQRDASTPAAGLMLTSLVDGCYIAPNLPLLWSLYYNQDTYAVIKLIKSQKGATQGNQDTYTMIKLIKSQKGAT